MSTPAPGRARRRGGDSDGRHGGRCRGAGFPSERFVRHRLGRHRDRRAQATPAGGNPRPTSAGPSRLSTGSRRSSAGSCSAARSSADSSARTSAAAVAWTACGSSSRTPTTAAGTRARLARPRNTGSASSRPRSRDPASPSAPPPGHSRSVGKRRRRSGRRFRRAWLRRVSRRRRCRRIGRWCGRRRGIRCAHALDDPDRLPYSRVPAGNRRNGIGVGRWDGSRDHSSHRRGKKEMGQGAQHDDPRRWANLLRLLHETPNRIRW